jgi:Uma2 family endonuclease
MSVPGRQLTIEDRIQVPSSAFDLEGFREWVKSDGFPEDVHATWVEGEVFVEMSPESVESHAKVKGEVTSVVVQIVRDGNLGEVYPDGVLLTHEAAGVSTEPDLAFASWQSLEKGRVRLLPKANRQDEFIEVEGTPDLVVEIVSDSSVRKDVVSLREAYRRAGIPEYWLVDARSSDIRFEILLLQGEDYRPSSPPGSAQRSLALGGTFTLTRERNPVGRWTYRLHHGT